MIVEKDVLVPTRHGDPVAVDVFRPPDRGAHPVIVTMSPYGKDVHWPDRYPLYEQADQGPYAVWETPYPEWWVERGYALVRADSPGTGKSPGCLDLLGEQEVNGYYDTVEWAAQQPWANGKAGALGISWLAILQWYLAALQPPHLAAIIPWEGMSDPYREFARHGGILNNAFIRFWWDKQIAPQQYGLGERSPEQLEAGKVDLLDGMRAHAFIDRWYEERTPDLSRITVPVLASANWGSLVLHHRGVLEAYRAVASECKQLVISSGTHIGPFYEDWAKQRQLRFLDRWLKDERNGAEDDPPVRLAVRSCGTHTWRDEHEWPLAQTRWTPLHLDATTRSLTWTPPAREGSVSYPAPEGEVAFTFQAEDEVELTGPVALRLWVSSSTEDTDVFVHIHQVGPDGEEYHGIGPQGAPLPLAMGWLRACHRELDTERSLPYRPVHTHERAVPLVPGEPTPLDIEIWPTCIVLPAGHRLVVRIRGNDDDLGVFAHDDPGDRDRDRLRGAVTVHTGGGYDSHLVVPVIPA